MLQISPFRSRLHWLTALAASCALILGGAHADAAEAPKLSDRPDLNEAQTALAGAVQYLDETQQKVTAPDGTAVPFAIDPFRRECLLQGLDDIGLTERYLDDIAAYEAKNP